MTFLLGIVVGLGIAIAWTFVRAIFWRDAVEEEEHQRVYQAGYDEGFKAGRAVYRLEENLRRSGII